MSSFLFCRASPPPWPSAGRTPSGGRRSSASLPARRSRNARWEHMPNLTVTCRDCELMTGIKLLLLLGGCACLRACWSIHVRASADAAGRWRKEGGWMHHADAVWRRVSQVSQTPMPCADAAQDTAGQGPCVWCLRRCSSQRCRARRRRMMSWRCLPGWARWRTSCSSRRRARSTTRWAFSNVRKIINHSGTATDRARRRAPYSSRPPARSTTGGRPTAEHQR